MRGNNNDYERANIRGTRLHNKGMGLNNNTTRPNNRPLRAFL